MATNFPALFFRVITVVIVSFCYLPSFGQDTSVLSKNKKTVIRYFDEVNNAHTLDRIKEFLSSDFIWHTMEGKDIQSSQDSSLLAVKRWHFAAMPDVHYTIDHIIAEGDIVALNTTATATAKAEMFGLPAGQKKVRYQQMFFYRLKNNKITEQWEVVDLDGIKAQLAKQ
jgi:steroid delta-isomerase-like uncharacterized protein